MRTSDPIEQVRIAYSDAGTQMNDSSYPDDERCLSFCTSEWLTADQAKAALDSIVSYNAFDAEDVGAMVEEIAEADPSARFAVAREGSPGLYVETDDAEVVVDILGPRRYELPEEAREESVFAPSKPDELGVREPDSDRECRVGTMLRADPDYDLHSMCRHDEPPVAGDEFAQADPERDVVRAWWD